MIKFLDLKKITAEYAEEIHEAVIRVVDSGWYLQGAETKKFEDNYASYIGTDFAVGTGNGLDAIYLIYKAYIELGIMKPGDEVIVPANTFIASVLAITENGLIPVFVDPDIRTLQIDSSKIEEKLSKKTKSVLLVHLYGKCAYNESIESVCRRYNLRLVEDNAQAHGCEYKGNKTGSLGDAAAHSFYPCKIIGALGDAGAVTTDDEDIAKMVRTLGNYGSSKKYIFDYTGKNSRIDEIQAAVLSVKIKYIDKNIEVRRQIAKKYYAYFSNACISMPEYGEDNENVFHIFPVLCNDRDNLQKYLLEKGIETLIHYPVPPYKQKCYTQYNDISYPVTEKIHKTELSIPISQVMTEDEVNKVIEAVNLFT